MSVSEAFKRQWDTEVPPSAPHPPPLVSARLAIPSDGEAPSAAQRWKRKAIEAGFQGVLTYARGWAKPRYDRPPTEIHHSCALRLVKLDAVATYRAVVCWHAKAHDGTGGYVGPERAHWTVDCVYAWMVGELPRTIPMTDLKPLAKRLERPRYVWLGRWLQAPHERGQLTDLPADTV